MDSARIFICVIGFTDVERHALNTVFRLSEERDLSYALWSPLTAPGVAAPLALPPVVLVDGACAEAVLYHAKPLPPGQRLIWVGNDAPAHAWRVLTRPLSWGELLHDLDSVYAAGQADSGLLDLDVTAPAELGDEDAPPETPRRALLAGLGPGERMLVMAELTRAAIIDFDEVADNETAVDRLARGAYCCGVFNLDEHQIDAWSLLQLFVQRNPHGLAMAMSDQAGPMAGWWRRRRIRGHARRAGISALVSRPPSNEELAHWFDLL
ncbi:MAG: hypothetical protein EP308_10350 [Burkholderiales bacterium]|nr:MAG: hypothetical protein EP308_10350 [Burkholderiales bacterium]